MAKDVRPTSQAEEHPSSGGGVAPPFEPPSLAKDAEEHYHYPIDKVVFGVAAALVVALLVWGLLSTRP